VSTMGGFEPRWASAPGRTIMTRLNELGIGEQEFADHLGTSVQTTTELLAGRTEITPHLAMRLAESIGGTQSFWERRDAQYRAGLRRVDVDRWVQDLPVADMVRYGWISKPDGWSATVAECFGFFDVRDLEQWRNVYEQQLASVQLRISAKVQVRTPAVAAWLRKASMETSQAATDVFDRDRLRSALPQLRALTRQQHPERFLPALRTLLAEAGVALAVVPFMHGCPASGAILPVGNDRALMVVSGRFLSDDQFWFTVFHEIGHLLIHELDRGCVDNPGGKDAVDSPQELEANEFAASTLLPSEIRTQIPTGRLTYRDVVRVAQLAGVSPGVVVGQLQFDERIDFAQLNKAKRRYRWNGPNLESA
jgi:HTH-type transcriptional regulator/antitoxin HigA